MIVETIDCAHVRWILEEIGVFWSPRLSWTRWRRWVWTRLLDWRGTEELVLIFQIAGAILEWHPTTGTKSKLIRVLAVEDEPKGRCERSLG